MRLVILVLGLTACVPVSDAAICDGLTRPVETLRAALIDNAAAVPEPVGEAGADVVTGFRAGCREKRNG